MLNFETSFFWKKTLFEKLDCRFLVESTTIENTTFPYKTPLSKVSVKRKIEWGVQNGPITKNAVLPLTALLFWKLNLILRTSLNS